MGADATGVCSASNLELVRSLGANHVIDYTKEDVAAGGQNYDVVVNSTGTAPFARSRGSLARGGRLLLAHGGFSDLLEAPWLFLSGDRKIVAAPARGQM